MARFFIAFVVSVSVMACAPTASAGVIRLDIKFTDPVINFGPHSFGFSGGPEEVNLPAEVNAVLMLNGGTTDGRGTTSYTVTDVVSASVPFGDANYTVTVLTEFEMDVLASGRFDNLRWSFGPLATPTVTDGYVVMNSPLHITGIHNDDITQGSAPTLASAQPFSYTYASSTATISAVSAVPEPTSLAMFCGIAFVGLGRRKRRVADTSR